MLNTDAHSPSVKNRMTKVQFIYNNNRINNGGPIAEDYMSALYDKIVNDEIKMETDGQLFTNAEKKGWLTKQGGRIKTWKRRWFILSDNCLYYFKSPKDSEPCGIIPLENLLVEEIPGKGKYMFSLTPPSLEEAIKSCKVNANGEVVQGHHNSYLIQAISAQERDSWIKAINSNIHHNPFYELLQGRGKK